MPMSPREAAKAWGVSRATIQRHINDGKLSVTRDEAGRQHIDPAEMQRAYGPPRAGLARPDKATGNSAIDHSEMAALRAENAALRDRLEAAHALNAAKDANLADMRTAMALLEHQAAPRRRWWLWGKS